MLVIDRIEGYMTVISCNGSTTEIPTHYLPDNVEEGDVITIVIDKAATKRRKKRIKKLSDDLFDKN